MNSRVLERVEQLLDSKNVESDWQMLTWLQKEQAPWLSKDEIEDCVIFSLVKYYGDHQLSWLWWQNKSQAISESLAA